MHGKIRIMDEFSSLDARELLDLLVQNVHEPDWCQALQRSFLSAFYRHQPQYRPEACLVASGSSRTALGILGFHCGITEVVIPDLSWSYEQCFPTVHAVPMTESLELDVDAMIEKWSSSARQDPSWPERGAVAINNPHNATGRIFDEEAIRRLIAYCLQHNIYVIDDLAYQNVAPVDGLPEIKTVRQIACGTGSARRHCERPGRSGDHGPFHVQDRLPGRGQAGGGRNPRSATCGSASRRSMPTFKPNLAAIFICYLFYRGAHEGNPNLLALAQRHFP